MTERTSSKFLKAVRYARIPAPHTREFSADQWRRDFQKLASGSRDENRVYHSGLWVGEELKKLWSIVSSLPCLESSREEIIGALMKFSYSYSREIEKKYVSAPEARQTFISGAPRFEGATFDQRLVLLGDTLARTLAYVFSIPSTGRKRRPLTEEEAALTLQIISRIYGLEYMMGRVIWCDWEMGFKGGPNFRPSDSASVFANSEAIAQHIHDMDVQEFVGMAVLQWRNGFGRDLCPDHLELSARSNVSTTFRIVNGPPTQLPEYLPLLMKNAPDWLAEVLQLSSPTLGGVHVGAVIRAWSTLNDAFRLIVEYDLNNQVSGEVLDHGLLRSDALVLLEQSGCPIPVATRLLDFLTYEGGRGEALWRAPLIPVADTLHPFLPALLHPNIAWLLDIWLNTIKYKTGPSSCSTLSHARGIAFEAHVRQSLAEWMARLRDVDAVVVADDKKILGHQIDLLMRVGQTVFVGEIKSTKYPVNPSDIGRYLIDLQKASEQVKVRVADIKRHVKSIAQKLHYNGDPSQLAIRPLIVTRHSLAAGLKLEGVPCLALDMLQDYFNSEGLTLSAVINEDATIRGGVTLRYPKSKSEIERCLDAFIEKPAHILIRENNISTVEHVIPNITSTGEPLHWSERVVEIPTEDMDGWAESCSARWEESITNGDRN